MRRNYYRTFVAGSVLPMRSDGKHGYTDLTELPCALACVVGGTCQGYEYAEISNAMPLSEVVKPLKEATQNSLAGFLRTRPFFW